MQLKTVFTAFVIGFALVACGKKKNPSDNGVGLRNQETLRSFSQFELQNDLDRLNAAEDELWYVGIVFLYFDGTLHVDVYPDAPVSVQVRALDHFIQSSDLVLGKYSGPFLLNSFGGSTVTRLSDRFLSELSHKGALARDAANGLTGGGRYGKPRAPNKPRKPSRGTLEDLLRH